MRAAARLAPARLTLWPMATAERTTFPPHELTDAEQAACVGRYVAAPTAEVGPPEIEGDDDFGRTPAPPHGTVYVAEGTELPDRIDIAEPAVAACTKTPAELGSTPDAALGGPVAKPEPTPEPEPEAPEAAAEPGAEPEAVEEIDVESLTVPQLKEQLDSLGVAYEADDRKADLQALLYEALEG